MPDYEVAPWVVVLVVVFTVWRAFHGQYSSDESWQATTHWLRRRLVRGRR